MREKNEKTKAIVLDRILTQDDWRRILFNYSMVTLDIIITTQRNSSSLCMNSPVNFGNSGEANKEPFKVQIVSFSYRFVIRDYDSAWLSGDLERKRTRELLFRHNISKRRSIW